MRLLLFILRMPQKAQTVAIFNRLREKDTPDILEILEILGGYLSPNFAV